MAACLAMLTKPQNVDISFSSKESFPDQTNRCPPPPTRAVIPTVTTVVFKGISEYMEDLPARIDVPLLVHLVLHFFYQPVVDMSQLPESIYRTEKFDLNSPVEAEIAFQQFDVYIFLIPPESVHGHLRFRLASARSDSSFRS
jgi:hypothetical protein